MSAPDTAILLNSYNTFLLPTAQISKAPSLGLPGERSCSATGPQDRRNLEIGGGSVSGERWVGSPVPEGSIDAAGTDINNSGSQVFISGYQCHRQTDRQRGSSIDGL